MKVGDRVPSIKLTSDAGKPVDLAAAAKSKAVIYFYPKDDTPGCTREAQGFTAAAKDFAALGATVFGISKDKVESHCKFRDKYKLTIPLLSDPDLVAHKAFGAYGEKTMYGKKVTGVIRSTFLVENGAVVRAWSSVKVDGHVDAVLAELRGEGAGGKPKKVEAKKAPASKATRKTAAPKTTVKKAAAKAAAPAKKKSAKK